MPSPFVARGRRAPALPVVLALLLPTVACSAVLGVEDVELGEGGAGGSAMATSSTAGGLPVGSAVSVSSGNASSTSSSGGGGSSSVSSSAASSSSSTGGGCNRSLPPCPGATGNAFADDEELELAWDVDQPKAEANGGQLELDPESDEGEEVYAGLKSKAPVELMPGSACAVSIEVNEVPPGLAAGIAIGPGEPDDDALTLERRGSSVVARIAGADVAVLPYDPETMRHLRISFEPGGMVGFDVSADAVCWRELVDPVPAGVTSGLVRLYAQGEAGGKAKMDDFCR